MISFLHIFIFATLGWIRCSVNSHAKKEEQHWGRRPRKARRWAATAEIRRDIGDGGPLVTFKVVAGVVNELSGVVDELSGVVDGVVDESQVWSTAVLAKSLLLFDGVVDEISGVVDGEVHESTLGNEEKQKSVLDGIGQSSHGNPRLFTQFFAKPSSIVG